VNQAFTETVYEVVSGIMNWPIGHEWVKVPSDMGSLETNSSLTKTNHREYVGSMPSLVPKTRPEMVSDGSFTSAHIDSIQESIAVALILYA